MAGVDEVAPGFVILDRYELIAELGRGAHAVVFHARDRAVGADIAIKVLGRARRLSPAATERLRKELRAGWSVTHPGVVRIHDLIVFGDHLALSMELVAGETLDRRLARGGKLRAPALYELATDLASALAAAHTAGVTHRDLKPSNLMIRATTGRAVITDFGLSQLEESAETPDGPAADVTAVGRVLSQAAASDVPVGLARVIDDCLAGRVADGNDLLRRLTALAAARRARARWIWRAAAAAAIALTFAVVWWNEHRRRPSTVTTPAEAPLPAATFETFADGPLQLAISVPGQAQEMVQRALRMPDGDLVIAGHTTTPFTIGGVTIALQPGLQNGYLIALSPTGEVKWHRDLASEHPVHVIDVAESRGALVVAGVNLGAVDLGNGATLKVPLNLGISDCFVASFDERDGAPRWALECRATEVAEARAVVADPAGNLYVAGWFLGEATFGGTVAHRISGNGGGAFVISLHPDGTLRWVAATTDVAGAVDGTALCWSGDELVFTGVVRGPSRFAGVDLVGDDDGDGFAMALDAATGTPRTVRTFGRGTIVTSAMHAGPPGLAIAGAFTGTVELVPGHPLVSAGGRDAFVALLDARDLHAIWAIAGGARYDEGAHDVAFAYGGLVSVGHFGHELDMGGRHLDGRGSDDSFLVALDLHGEVTALTSFGSADADMPQTITAEPDGILRFTGWFADTARVAGHVIHRGGAVLELRRIP